ncbi:MAG: hypothetical protein KC550_07655, partial [Nanoarchaeota archaeon]|nr:hypothetical protein [Nanoarchaeota archaeon]
KIGEIVNYTKDGIKRKYIVVSAKGKKDPNNSNEIKDTRSLENLVAENSSKKRKNIIELLLNGWEELAKKDSKELPKLENELNDRLNKKGKMSTSAFNASIVAFGEEVSARLLAERHGIEYVNSKELFLLEANKGNYRNGIYLKKESEIMMKNRLSGTSNTIITEGFCGQDKEGNIITFPIGGSDISQAYLGAGLNVDVCENFTDSGIAVANPRIIRNPKIIDEITFRELRELTVGGFDILHEDVVLPLEEKLIPIHVRGTGAFPEIGTLVVSNRYTEEPICGIAYRDNFCKIEIDFPGLNSISGIGHKIPKVFHDHEVEYSMDSSSVDSMSYLVEGKYLKGRLGIPDLITREIRDKFNGKGNVNFKSNYGALVVVGNGMIGRQGTHSEVTRILADVGVNIDFSSQSKEMVISFGINSSRGKQGVRALYDHFFPMSK